MALVGNRAKIIFLPLNIKLKGIEIYYLSNFRSKIFYSTLNAVFANILFVVNGVDCIMH